MTPQELIAKLALLDEHTKDTATALSEAFGDADPEDVDALRLDEAERLITRLRDDIDQARDKLLTYLGARTLAEQLERPMAKR